MIRFVLFIMPYFMLIFCNEKWKDDNVNLYKRKVNKYFQPILYRINKRKNIEIGLLIYEDFCYLYSCIIIIECVINYFFDKQFEFVLIIIFFCSLLFLGINNIISELKNFNNR